MKYCVDITEIINKLKSEYDNINSGYEDKLGSIKLHIDKIDKLFQQEELHKFDKETKNVLLETKDLLVKQHVEMKNFKYYIQQGYEELVELEKLFNKLKGTHKADEGIKFLDIQQEERNRVARELHDSTVQNLTGLIYKTELCSRFLDSDITRVRLELQLIIVSLKNIIEEMRQIIYDLRPDSSQNGFFHNYMEKYIQDCNMQYSNIEFCIFIKGHPKNLSEVYFEGLTRIIKEACHNAVKYSKATNIDVSLDYGSTGLKVKVSDNGVGFDWEEYKKGDRNKFGISIMQERAELMRAKFRLDSVIGKGTNIYVDVPKCLSGVN